ncbi:helicase-related protein, partial [Actinotignum timonense]
GIDVDDVTHVVNYQCPEDEKIYIHRIGRTGRAGNKGTAVTFVDWEDMPRWSLISKQLNLGMADPVETYHTSDHLYTDLDIPTDAGSTLPESQRVLAGLDAEEIEDLGETGHSR